LTRVSRNDRNAALGNVSGRDVPVRNAYVALHTSEKLESATKTGCWVGVIGQRVTPCARGAFGVHSFQGVVGEGRRRARVPLESCPTIVFAGVLPPSFARPPSRMWCTISATWCAGREGGREENSTPAREQRGRLLEFCEEGVHGVRERGGANARGRTVRPPGPACFRTS
jgi:hypothetical protein